MIAAAPLHFQTTRSFSLAAGPASRTFTMRERSGVILVNRITVPRGVRAYVVATIPKLAGAGVQSWPTPRDPTLACTHDRGRLACRQGEEWCPMPQATWHFRLVKLRGPAGTVRVDYRVAPPPP
ncbi:MAG TPA: hypothetical protein VH538_03105 [Gaiellaceae bacterium]|jgi:hypothetical protein